MAEHKLCPPGTFMRLKQDGRYGGRSAKRKLTSSEVREIRNYPLSTPGTGNKKHLSQIEIGDRYGISGSSVSAIRRRKNYQWIK